METLLMQEQTREMEHLQTRVTRLEDAVALSAPRLSHAPEAR